MTAAELARIAHALGGAVRDSQGWRCRCPVHDGQDANLSLQPGDTVPLVVKCWSRDCDRLDILDELRRRGLLADDRQHDRQRYRPAARPRPARPPDAAPHASMADILRPAVGLPGTPAERYFKIRGCAQPTGDSVRYLPPSAKYPWPTIVSIITDVVTCEPISLHFTMLNMDGTDKAPIDRPRRLLAGHRKAGGVIRLTDNADLERHLGIAEGIESALAVTAAMGAMAHWIPTWSAIDAGNLAELPVLDAVQRLSIFSDTDPSGTGQRAAEKLATRWHAAGREVFLAQPPAPEGRGRDWNG